MGGSTVIAIKLLATTDLVNRICLHGHFVYPYLHPWSLS